jgi:hypothetical protein
MIRKYKAFGLALVAMLALGAFAAQGASAVPLTCESLASGATCFGTGDQDGGTHVFKSAGGSVTCTEAVFSSATVVGAGGAINEQTVTANYPTAKAGGGNNCTAFGFAGAHVNMNECKYTFTTPTQIAGQPTGVVTFMNSSETEPLHLTCPVGKEIEITPTAFGASVCTQKVPPQTPTAGHVVGRNAGTVAEMDVTLEITLTSLHYTGTGSSCGNSETHSDASLTGNSTVKCYSNAGHTTRTNCTFS